MMTPRKTTMPILGMLFTAVSAFAYSPEDDLLLVVQTNLPGLSEDNQFMIPTAPNTPYSYAVDCENDGSYESTGVTGNYTCSYPTGNNATPRIIRITGLFPHIYFNGEFDAEKLLYVEQWGSQQWSSMAHAFMGCRNLIYLDNTRSPDLTGVTDMSDMFSYATNFNMNPGFSDWNVSQVTKMQGMFYNANLFNQDIGNWDVSNVTSMNSMFTRAYDFNHDIGAWDVSNVTDMNYMFFDAVDFNQNIGSWDVSKVKSMDGMFKTSYLSGYVSSFAQDLGDWDVSNVIYMKWMFYGASLSMQDLGMWDVSQVKNMEGMFTAIRLSVNDYDSLLTEWRKLPLQDDVNLDAGLSRYCSGADAKAALIAEHNWSIADAGEYCSFHIDSPRTVTVKSGKSTVQKISVHGNDGSDIVYSIIGGVDGDKFMIDAALGILKFIDTPDVAHPTDNNSDNVYRVRVKAKHPLIDDRQTIRVKVVSGNAAMIPIRALLLN